MKRALSIASCLVFLICLASPSSLAKRPMTVEDLWSFKRVGSPAVSPDGRWVAFGVSVYDAEENKGNSDLWLVPADGSAPPRQLTFNKGSDGSPAWSPDGKTIAFVSKRGDNKKSQLYLLELAGGDARPLTDIPISVSNPIWFPDGSKIGFIAKTWPDLNDDFEKIEERNKEREDDKVGAFVSESRLVRFWDRWVTDETAPHIFSVDLESKKVTDLTPDLDKLMGLMSPGGGWDIAPDGKEIVFAANATPQPYTTLNYDLFTLSLANGKIENITADNPTSDSRPRYTPDGKTIVFGRNDRVEIAPDFTHLARYDRRSKKVSSLAKSFDSQPGGWTISDDSKTVLFQAQHRGRLNLYTVALNDKSAPKLIAEGGRIDQSQLAKDGTVVFRRQSLVSPAELFRTSLSGGTPKQITDVNGELLAELDMGTTEDVSFTGADGNKAQMWVIHPPGFDAKKKWPLLVAVHGGPHGAWLDQFHYRWNGALFAAPGYVVAMVNFHGSTGFGQEFAESILGNHAEKPFYDTMKATDAMLERGYVDPDRLAAAGGSYGGYLVSWILGHTDRFATLINHAGVYDLMAQFASDYTWSRSNNYGATPWEDPDRIDLYSPSRYAKNFNTPTLIIHGSKDYRVPVTQGLNLHGVLTAKGVQSRLVVFPKENHWILTPQGAELWWGEVHGWLDRQIGTGPQAPSAE